MDAAHGGAAGWSRAALTALLLVQTWVLATALARLELSGLERGVFDLVHAAPAPVAVPLRVLAPLGTLAGGLVTCGLGWLVARPTGRRLTLAVPVAWVAAMGTKSAVARGRPADLLDAVVTTATAQGPGYPSGHTAVVVAVAVALWPDLGRAGRVAVVVVAAAVALGRVTTGVHLPLDLVGGAAIGGLAGLGARALADRATFRG